MKKLLLVLCMIISIFSMTANVNAETKDYNGYTEDDLKSNSESLYQSLSSFTDDQIAQYLASGDQITIQAVQSWSDIKDSLGEYVKIGKFTVEESDDAIVTKLTVDYSKSDMILTVSYDQNLSVTGIVAEKGANSSVIFANPINTLIILAIIIIVLLVAYISVVIFIYVKKNNAKSGNAKSDEPIAGTPVVATSVVNGNLVDDFELVAVIAAAIAAATNSSTDEFVVRSIKRRTKIQR